MKLVNFVRGWSALVVWAVITAVFVLVTVTLSFLYRPMHYVFLKDRDTPFAYVSIIYHTIIVTVCYKWIAGMRFVNESADDPGEHVDDSVIFVPGPHPPSLLMIPYFYLVCSHLCRKILVTTKAFDPNKPDYLTALFAFVLDSMGCHIPMARGQGLPHVKLAGHLSESISRLGRNTRALTMYTDKSRPRITEICKQRERYSKMLMREYGIEDDLSWMMLSLFPQIRGFLATIDAMPTSGRVVFLFAGLDRPMWKITEPERMVGSTFRFRFHEESMSYLKKHPGENQRAWEKRITLYLIQWWKRFNLEKATWQHSATSTS